ALLALRQGSAFVPSTAGSSSSCSRQQQQFVGPRAAAPIPNGRCPVAAVGQTGTPSFLGRRGAARALTRSDRQRTSSSKLGMVLPGVENAESMLTIATAATAAAGAGVPGVGDVSAWSVTSLTSDLAADLFQASLLPYLAFLFFLSRKETKTPEGGTFGFAFLLVFVAATIPAGIYAKLEYNEILANVDYLHGLAESFLTITNLFIVAAFRKAVVSQEQPTAGNGSGETVLRSSASATAAVAALAAAPLVLAAAHAEPANALSFPTWMVHVSSLIEWLAAMTYVWRFADVSGLKEWKGLTWGMLPLHTSGLIACTYHIFYNSPELISLVAMQAGLTCFGNATMAFATWRVWQAGKQAWKGDEVEEAEAAALAAAAVASGDG
ncbi:unnamed protein product, partial [Laminaria digitata]